MTNDQNITASASIPIISQCDTEGNRCLTLYDFLGNELYRNEGLFYIQSISERYCVCVSYKEKYCRYASNHEFISKYDEFFIRYEIFDIFERKIAYRNIEEYKFFNDKGVIYIIIAKHSFLMDIFSMKKIIEFYEATYTKFYDSCFYISYNRTSYFYDYLGNILFKKEHKSITNAGSVIFVADVEDRENETETVFDIHKFKKKIVPKDEYFEDETYKNYFIDSVYGFDGELHKFCFEFSADFIGYDVQRSYNRNLSDRYILIGLWFYTEKSNKRATKYYVLDMKDDTIVFSTDMIDAVEMENDISHIHQYLAIYDEKKTYVIDVNMGRFSCEIIDGHVKFINKNLYSNNSTIFIRKTKKEIDATDLTIIDATNDFIFVQSKTDKKYFYLDMQGDKYTKPIKI